jgi:hypothetical protein
MIFLFDYPFFWFDFRVLIKPAGPVTVHRVRPDSIRPRPFAPPAPASDRAAPAARPRPPLRRRPGHARTRSGHARTRRAFARRCSPRSAAPRYRRCSPRSPRRRAPPAAILRLRRTTSTRAPATPSPYPGELPPPRRPGCRRPVAAAELRLNPVRSASSAALLGRRRSMKLVSAGSTHHDGAPRTAAARRRRRSRPRVRAGAGDPSPGEMVRIGFNSARACFVLARASFVRCTHLSPI